MAERPGRRVVLAANSSWNIVNFRHGLIRALKAEGYDPLVIAPREASTEQRIAELGVEWLEVPVDRSGMNPLADLRLIARYRRLLKRTRPAAFLGFTIKPNIYGAIAARSLGIPVIANISGLGTVFIKRGLLLALVTRLYRLALSNAAVVFFQNPEDRELFLERGIVRAGQARLIPGSGVDPQGFAAAPLPEGPPMFLLVARLLGDKGVREFVAAARSLRAELPQARFQLLGPLDEGNRTAIARSELDRWVNDGDVEYLGETHDVRPFVAAATAIVLPSYREGLPRTLLEAGAMGRPLIATDVPGCRQVVEEGLNGFLSRARDAESLASAMRRLAQLDLARIRAMGAESRRKVVSEYSEAVVFRAYLDALEKVAAHRS
ncbi:MAG TPA: glycosyltransferase family 4 protein [Sphingomicrobium sp.]|nr:glycosyltransferase family 4 protein [Sphingomicrobium sp.]